MSKFIKVSEDVFIKLSKADQTEICDKKIDSIYDMFKARVTKYIRRIPNPSGKGFIYFYNQADIDAYKKSGIIPGQKQKGSWINAFMGIFGYKEKKEVEIKIKEDYKKEEVKEKFGLSLEGWNKHIAEYFSNKMKWDNLFNKKAKAQKEVNSSTPAEKLKSMKKEQVSAEKISKEAKKGGFNTKAMYFIFNYYKKEEKINERISRDTKDGSKLPTGGIPTTDDAVHSGRTEGVTIANVPEAKPTSNKRELVVGSFDTGVGSGRDVRLTTGQIRAQRAQILELLKNKTNEEMTPEDIALLRSYEGGGGTKEEGRTDEEILYAFYTPQKVVDKVWNIVDKYIGTGPKRVLEPSSGSGRFAENQPEDRKFTMFELDPTSARINTILHPEADIMQKPFQEMFMKGGVSKPEYSGKKFDVTVGNPPYGKYSGFYKGKDEGKDHTRYEEYFIDRALDALEPGGIMAYVVPSDFLRKGNYTKAKSLIASKGRLMEAYRLPNGTFSTTKEGTDIIVIRKEKGNIDDFLDDKYFKKNPEKIMGDVSIRSGKFGPEQYVALKPGETFDSVLDKINTNDTPVTPYEKPEMSDEAKRNISIGLKGNDNAKKAVKKIPKKQMAVAGKPVFPTKKEEAIPVQGEQKAVETVESFNSKYNKKLNPEEVNIWKNTDYNGNIESDKLNAKEKAYIDTSENICLIEGKYVHKVNYASGDIYKKLEILESEKDQMPEAKYLNQKALLDAVKPSFKTTENFSVSPISDFAKNFTFDSEDYPDGINFNRRFLQWATGQRDRHYNMDWKGGVTKHDIPAGISWSDIIEYIK